MAYSRAHSACRSTVREPSRAGRLEALEHRVSEFRSDLASCRDDVPGCGRRPHRRARGVHDSWPIWLALPFIVRDLHPLLLPVSRLTRALRGPRSSFVLKFFWLSVAPVVRPIALRIARGVVDEDIGFIENQNQRALASSQSNLKSAKTPPRKPRRRRNSSSRPGLRATPNCWGSPSTSSHPIAGKTWMPGLRPA
jgi:hypothetical protein